MLKDCPLKELADRHTYPEGRVYWSIMNSEPVEAENEQTKGVPGSSHGKTVMKGSCRLLSVVSMQQYIF